MTVLNFPNAPTVGQLYPSPPVTGQPTYQWDGTEWLSHFALGIPYVPLDGSQPMTGLLTLSGNPTALLHAAPKQYVDAGLAAIAPANVALVRSYLAGLTISPTSGVGGPFGVAAGVAADSTNVVMLALAAAITKTNAAWAVGNSNGALDTGTVAPGTWYHVYLIRRPDTGVVDVLISLSATAPTLPTNYTQFRRIGAMIAIGLGWGLYTQLGDDFLWNQPVAVMNGVTPPATLTLFSLAAAVPTGVNVRAWFDVEVTNSNILKIVSPYNTLTGGFVTYSFGSGSTAVGCAPGSVMTDTSARLLWRGQAAIAASAFMDVNGWTDRRGRDN